MKEGIHPKTYEVLVKCSCGHEIQTISTSKEVHVSICSACHPFFTGKQKILDTAGRVEKFKQRFAKKDLPQKKAPRTITIS
ncbi:MAG: 50S ribosomal protein L31 [Deltaproteobacteria bacterium]|nr:50S ribosomal protein L31 [Deltaproteobacteria bacterium]